MSPLWYPNSWEASLVVGDAVTPLKTTFPITDTVGTGNKTIEAQAVWLGLGTPADFRDRESAARPWCSTATRRPAAAIISRAGAAR